MTVSDAPLTPVAFLERSADAWSERPALRDGGRSWTYAEHHERVRRLVGGLGADLGIGAGDRVAALVPNVASMLELHHAVPASQRLMRR